MDLNTRINIEIMKLTNPRHSGAPSTIFREILTAELNRRTA